MSLHKIAIVGRPNVGKSTMFNTLCRKKLATVNEQPGITRDRKKYAAELFDLKFTAIDTAGWDDSEHEMESRMVAQTRAGINEADILFFMIDGREPTTALDYAIADVVRESGKPTILIVNKTESLNKASVDFASVYSLGFSDPIYISAAHRQGLDDLHESLQDMMKTTLPNSDASQEAREDAVIAIAGRPNAGKSTLFNAILQSERSIVCSEAGTTRDSVVDRFNVNESDSMEIIDTAGLPKKSKGGRTAYVGQTIAAVRRANVVLLVMDVNNALERQDLTIARMAINEGKGIVIVINKIDLLSKKELEACKSEMKDMMEKNLGDLFNPPVVYISALTSQNLEQIMQSVDSTFASWQKKIATSKLNSWLRQATQIHEPPLTSNKRRIRFKYMTQIAGKPPTFQINCNSEKIPNSYMSYLKQSLANRFGFVGTPIRMKIAVSHNPYVK